MPSEPLLTYEVVVEPPSLPKRLAALLNGYTFVSIVRSYAAPSRVYRVTRTGFPASYLKVGAGLRRERDRLRWLQGKLVVPRVQFYAESCGQGFMLLTEVSGRPANSEELGDDPHAVVVAVARAVRAIHAVPVVECPFDARVDVLLKAARQAVRGGLVAQSEFSKSYRHLTAEEILRTALRIRPSMDDQTVFTHGDCCLPNILIAPSESTGVVDLGCAGLSNPWRDLALVTRSIRRNLGQEWVVEFFASYGEDVDEAKIEFFALLDQLTMMRRR